MGALKNNIKQSNETIKDWLKRFAVGYSELMTVIFGQEDISSDNLEEALKATKKDNPEVSNDIDKIGTAIKFQQESSSKKIEKIFGKDEDGYNKIPNKLEGIETKVSEKEALKGDKKVKTKGGKQKTRVDED